MCIRDRLYTDASCYDLFANGDGKEEQFHPWQNLYLNASGLLPETDEQPQWVSPAYGFSFNNSAVAAKLDACFALEPVFVHALDTVEKLRTLKETVGDGAHFHVIFDPVNVLTAENVDNQDALWPAWCEVIGKDLAAVHVKDAVLHPDAPRTPTALGAGQMDYTVIREWLHRGHPTAALLRDEVILPVAQEDLAYMRTL